MSKSSAPKPAILLFMLGMMLLAACSKDEVQTYDMGYRYFPDQPGHYVVYQVDSTHWDDFTDSVYTFHYQVMEVIESVYTDEQGRPTLRLERYKRESDTAAWVICDVWFANRTASTAEKVEENVRYVKLIFPVERGADWNGNIYNTDDEQDYEFTEVNQAYSLPGLSFDSACTVLQVDEENLISRNYGLEVYASGVGMIYKRYIKQTRSILGVIESGKDYTYTALWWGVMP